MLVGNEIFGNAKNGINLYQNSDYLYLFGNDVRVRADTTGNALDIRDGAHVVSGGNRYQGGLEAAVAVNVTARAGSRFVDDALVDRGRKRTRATVQSDGGVQDRRTAT